MSDFSITDIRIDGKRYYAVGKGHDDRVSCYTTNIAAARFWIRSEENDPTLIRPFQDPPVVASVAKKSDDSNKDTENDPTVSADPAQTANPAEDPASAEANPESNTSEGSEEVPKKPVRIS